MSRVAWCAGVTVVVAGALGGGIGIGINTARAQGGRVPSPMTSSTMIGPAAAGMAGPGGTTNPLMNPYMNPYVYSAYAPQGQLGAAYLFMSMEQAQAQAAQARSAAAGATSGRSRGVPRGAMMTPGGGASGYFGGGSAPAEAADVAPVGPRGGSFLRQDRYFRPNGY